VSYLMRLAVVAAVIAVALEMAAPYVHDLFVPAVVLLLLVYVGRVIWWYTSL
jgi:hypothetical protein